MDVIGSSSEARFKNIPEELSDALNTRVAELRGQNVKGLLRKTLGDFGLPTEVQVKATFWSAYSDIKRTAIHGVHYDSLTWVDDSRTYNGFCFVARIDVLSP